jgi:hypothetical protein
MQTLDVQAPKVAIEPVRAGNAHAAGGAHAVNGKTGAETARNGSSFLAMIEKMIAGTKEGKGDALAAQVAKMAGRGAGDAKGVPGDENTLIKSGFGKALVKAVPEKKSPQAGIPLTARAAKPVRAGHHVSAGGNALHPVEDGANVPGAGKVMPSGDQERLALFRKEIAGKAEEGESLADGTAKPAAKKNLRGGTASSREDAVALAGIPNAAQGRAPTVTKTAGAGEGEISGVKSGKADRKDRKVVIDVRDERTDRADALQQSPLVKSTSINGDGSADMTIGFHAIDGSSPHEDASGHLTDAKKAEGGQSFASMLSQELKANAADLVKTGSIVLRDNNVGTIRLTLHPESLGNVKISLELSDDKRISGKIVVSSQEAYEAFNENLDGLSKAFVDGGFQGAGFDLSWSGQGGSGGKPDDASAKLASPFYASSIPDVMSAPDVADRETGAYRSYGNRAINVFA